MVVKGSEQYRSVVVPYRPRRRIVLLALAIGVIGAGVFGSYHYGYREAQANYRQAMDEWNQLHELASQQAEQLQQLNQQVANTQVGSNVDKQTVEQLKQQIMALNEQVTSLQESNNFYRQLMDQPEKNKGLVIGSFKVKPSGLPSRFHYELVMQLFTTEHRLTTGKVNITLTGDMGGQSHTYSVAELSDKPVKMDIPLKLRFYQTITGELVLPEGFAPKRVDISAEKNGEPAITATFDWVVKQ